MIDILVCTILIISLITDLYNRKILNIVTLPAIGIAITFHTVNDGWQGLLFSGEGLLVGFALLLVPFFLGGMGAGDVKLLAAVGALKGTAFVFSAFLYTTIAGGLIAVVILIIRKQFMAFLKRIFYTIGLLPLGKHALNLLEPANSSYALPYGVAIAVGTFIAYGWSGY